MSPRRARSPEFHSESAPRRRRRRRDRPFQPLLLTLGGHASPTSRTRRRRGGARCLKCPSHVIRRSWRPPAPRGASGTYIPLTARAPDHGAVAGRVRVGTRCGLPRLSAGRAYAREGIMGSYGHSGQRFIRWSGQNRRSSVHLPLPRAPPRQSRFVWICWRPRRFGLLAGASVGRLVYTCSLHVTVTSHDSESISVLS